MVLTPGRLEGKIDFHHGKAKKTQKKHLHNVCPPLYVLCLQFLSLDGAKYTPERCVFLVSGPVFSETVLP